MIAKAACTSETPQPTRIPSGRQVPAEGLPGTSLQPEQSAQESELSPKSRPLRSVKHIEEYRYAECAKRIDK